MLKRSYNYIISFPLFLLTASIVVSCLSCHHPDKNHLANATSPYLKEHADNPVNWYEWNNDVLKIAEQQGKPLLISIGYSSCHWCHVMEEESFMDTAIARLMNENFICIKVDREERPDIDNLYSQACQLINGSSGWPLNCFAIPDGKPFYAITYSPKNNWADLLKKISATYQSKKGTVELQARMIAQGISEIDFLNFSQPSPGNFNKDTYKKIFENLYANIDLQNGGIKGAVKFPLPTTLEFLLQYYFFTKDNRALNAATITLNKMALGGIYDQIGSGFSRYSTDSLWHVPHFEKMLYDNAQLISVYTHAYQITHNDFFASIARDLISFIEKNFKSIEGGYYSSLNADTNEGEGNYYSWSSAELKTQLGNNYQWFASYYNVSDRGNWQKNRNILYTNENVNNSFSDSLSTIKQQLLITRNKRNAPTIDKKIITSWNALLLKGYADAYACFGDSMYLIRSVSLASFLEKNMIQKDGDLRRIFINASATINGLLEDYACLAEAYTRLYQVTFNKHWLDLAKKLVDVVKNVFYDNKSQLFLNTATEQQDKVIPVIGITDKDLPSANAVMTTVLSTLSRYYENEQYAEMYTNIISQIFKWIHKDETSFPSSWASITGLYVYGTDEVAIIGKNALIKNSEIQRNYLPNALFAGSSEEENLPLLAGKKVNNQTLLYVCQNKVCKMPVKESEDALTQLNHSINK